MSSPRVGGGLSTNGTFPYCDGCTLNSEVDLQTEGLHATMIMASVVLKSIFAFLFTTLFLCTIFAIQPAFPKHLNKPHGTKLFLPRVTCLTSIATILYTICIAYPEASERIKASFLIIYPCLVAARLSAEASLAPCLAFFVVNRITVYYGSDSIPPVDIHKIKRVATTIISLLVAAQVIISILLTILSLNQQFSASKYSKYDLYTGISNKVATVLKSIYLVLSIVYVPFAIKALHLTPSTASGNKRLITTFVLVASIFYCIWTICALALHLLSTYTPTIPQHDTYLISIFAYDLPLLLCEMFLVLGALQRDWYFEDGVLPGHGPAQPYNGAPPGPDPYHAQPGPKPTNMGPTLEFINRMNMAQNVQMQQQIAANNQQMQINQAQNWPNSY